MSNLHEAFTYALAEQYPNVNILETISKEVLSTFESQPHLELVKTRLHDRTVFCRPGSTAVCLELFTSRILFRRTRCLSPSPHHIDSVQFRLDRENYVSQRRTFIVKETSYEYISLPDAAWEHLHRPPTLMRTGRLRVPRSLSGREINEHPLASSSEISRDIASTEHRPPILGFMVLFMSDQIHSVTISRCDNDRKIKLDILTTKPPSFESLEASYSSVTEQYSFYSKGPELHVEFGKGELENLMVPARSKSPGDTTQHTFGQQSSSSQRPDDAPVDLMLDLSIRNFVFPTIVMALWLRACEIDDNDNEDTIEKLAKSNCPYSLKFLDADKKAVLELPVSTLKDSSGRIRLLVKSESTSIILGIPLLELYDITIFKAKEKNKVMSFFSGKKDSKRQGGFRASFASKNGR
ncbi:unnamed protein product [Albugo candida]|uniref:Uncharacterized protein n=1 Tax=Albugo candida TaxID=65357 RepID=A0A024GVE6_9STRA|nr:unnamed protein product [Albugo candida]|eukprot:CCI50805.1 unnamed protein product [Albugo candida]